MEAEKALELFPFTKQCFSNSGHTMQYLVQYGGLGRFGES